MRSQPNAFSHTSSEISDLATLANPDNELMAKQTKKEFGKVKHPRHVLAGVTAHVARWKKTISPIERRRSGQQARPERLRRAYKSNVLKDGRGCGPDLHHDDTATARSPHDDTKAFANKLE